MPAIAGAHPLNSRPIPSERKVRTPRRLLVAFDWFSSHETNIGPVFPRSCNQFTPQGLLVAPTHNLLKAHKQHHSSPQPLIGMTAQLTNQSMRPLKKLAFNSTTTCATQATVYAKCIVATYTDVTKDICKDEFQLFKTCLRNAVSAFEVSSRVSKLRFHIIAEITSINNTFA